MSGRVLYLLVLAGFSFTGTQLCGPVYEVTGDPLWVWIGIALILVAVAGLVGGGVVALARKLLR